jgi:hypothetical protein
MRNEAAYSWTREGVSAAVEATMECWPRLREAFDVAATPGESNEAIAIWVVTLDPQGTPRLARIRSSVIEEGALQQVAQALRAALTER